MNEFALKIRDAWEKPTFREQCDASSNIEKEFRSVIGDKQLAKGSRSVKELLAVKTNGRFAERLHSMVYIRNHIQDRNGNPVEIRGHWRNHSKKYMEEKLGEFLRLDEKSKNKPEYKTKATFWKKDFDDRSAFRFNESFAEGSDCFSACAEAQMLRFAAGASVNAEMDLKKGTLKIGDEGIPMGRATEKGDQERDGRRDYRQTPYWKLSVSSPGGTGCNPPRHYGISPGTGLRGNTYRTACHRLP